MRHLLLQAPPTPPAPAPEPSTSSADYFYVFKLPQDAPTMPDTMSVLKYLVSQQPTYPGEVLCMLLSKPKDCTCFQPKLEIKLCQTFLNSLPG